jgi:hypothetical protein
MWVLQGMKPQINWQEQDLNSRSQDLNQLAASQLELPKKQRSTKMAGRITYRILPPERTPFKAGTDR